MTPPLNDDRLLDQEQIDDIISSASPEEAYKKFCDAVSRALPKLIHDAVVSAALGVRRAGGINGATGWQRYLNAVAVDVGWGQPGLRTPPSSIVTVYTASQSSLGVSVSVCVGAHF